MFITVRRDVVAPANNVVLNVKTLLTSIFILQSFKTQKIIYEMIDVLLLFSSIQLESGSV